MNSNGTKKRDLPDWLKVNFPKVNSADNCIVRVAKLQIDETNTIITKKDDTKICEIDKKIECISEAIITQPAKRYRTRSSISSQPELTTSQREKRDRPKALPRSKPAFIEYKGKVEYYTEFYDIAFAADTLLNWVNKQQTNEMIPIAFDMEWPFTFVTGPERTAVIQLCAETDLCYVFHVANLKKLPSALVLLLTHDKVCLNGVNIKNDCRKLERDFPEINSQKMVDQCIDLGPYCNEVMNTGGRWSMERLVWQICRLKINKDKKVRNSKWHIMPLTEEQQIYAAIDVYISQVMFHKLRKAEIEKEDEARKFIEEFGEAAFAAKEKLL